MNTNNAPLQTSFFDNGDNNFGCCITFFHANGNSLKQLIGICSDKSLKGTQ